MQKQLQDKVDRDQAEEQKRQAQHDHRAVHRDRIEAWKSGKKVSLLPSCLAICQPAEQTADTEIPARGIKMSQAFWQEGGGGGCV